MIRVAEEADAGHTFRGKHMIGGIVFYKRTYLVIVLIGSCLTLWSPCWGKIELGPVVQSIVSLTSSLRVLSLTVLADSIHNILIFFAEKMWVAFAMQKLLTFFQQKISAYTRITWSKF